MSLDIRYLTNGTKNVYVVAEKDVTPVAVHFYSERDEIPYQIRHYAPKGKPMFVGPDGARLLFAMKALYPELIHEFCDKPEYAGSPCIFESCSLADWKTCKYRCTAKIRVRLGDGDAQEIHAAELRTDSHSE